MSIIHEVDYAERAKRQDSDFKTRIWKMDASAAVGAAEALGFDMGALARVVGTARPDGSSRRLDAGESALLARALIYMKAQSVDVQYAPTKFREVFSTNLNTSMPLGAKQMSTPQFDRLGAFGLAANSSSDAQRIDVVQAETLATIFPFTAHIKYSVFDLAAAAFSGIPLDTKKMQMARMAWEQHLDGLAAVGDSTLNITGISNVSGAIAVTTNNAGTWATKIAAGNQLYVVDDVAKVCTSIISTTKGNIEPDTLALGVAHYSAIAVAPLSLTNATNVTVLDFIKASNPWIKRVIPWARLDTAGGSSLPRVMAFSTRSDVCEFVINDLQMLAPQMDNFDTKVSMFGRCAGVVAAQPKGVAYMDAV